MSDRFRITKSGDRDGPWEVEYPHGFDDADSGALCETFADAVAAFIEAANRECPMCLKGAVVDTDFGWRCEACDTYDVAVGCEEPA